MSKKIAIILSGCGFKDGAEIHESVLTLLALNQLNVTPLIYAPSIEHTVTNHLTGESKGEKRNILEESARIARGNIKDIKNLKVNDADALILPGGFGAAMNLSDFGKKGADCKVLTEVEDIIRQFYEAKKPIGAICIAPAVVGKVLGKHHVQLTIGTDPATAAALEKMGVKHQACAVDEICIDSQNKIISTPAYMLAKNIAEAEKDISKLVKQVVSMIP